MCRAVDVAKFAISESIKLADNDERYYLDFYKINKILYLAQGVFLAKRSRTLFVDDIYAMSCGPYIKELEFIFKDWDFENITTKYEIDVFLPPEIEDAIKIAVKYLGKYDKQQLGLATKKQLPWKQSYLKGEQAISIEKMLDFFSGEYGSLDTPQIYEVIMNG